MGDGFYSQHGEDRWIVEHWLELFGFPLPEQGVFVEVGADDGVENSNTLHFELRGWRGLCIEPDPWAFTDLQRWRKCRLARCAIGTPGPERKFIRHPKKGWSGFNRDGGVPIDVETRPLTGVLAEFPVPPIDLLSIDTEGTELEVLETLDFAAYTPRIVIVEYWTDPKPPADQAIRDWFRDRLPGRYAAVHQTAPNLIFGRIT